MKAVCFAARRDDGLKSGLFAAAEPTGNAHAERAEGPDGGFGDGGVGRNQDDGQVRNFHRAHRIVGFGHVHLVVDGKGRRG